MAEKKPTQAMAFEAVAASLREFGYPGTTALNVKDVWVAMLEGASIPHGVVGQFALSQLEENRGWIAALPQGNLTPTHPQEGDTDGRG